MSSKLQKSLSLCTRIIAPLALVAPIWAQEGEAPAAAPAEQASTAAPESTSIFGEPLIVNGKRISDTAIKQFLCYGKGRNGLESLRLGLLMDQERELRAIKASERMLEDNFGGKELSELSEDQTQELEVAVAAEMSRFNLNPAEYELRFAKESASFSERYPTLDLTTEIRRAYKSMDWWRDQIRMTMEFDQLFFPGHPDGWPDLSLEAVHQASPQFDLVEDYTKYFDMRQDEQAGSLGSGGDVFVLDMGKPIHIIDLARRMIRLSGFLEKDEEHPEGDIEITYTGLRPGEKLYEELLIGDNVSETQHQRIMRAQEKVIPWQELAVILSELEQANEKGDYHAVRRLLVDYVDGFQPQCDIEDWLQ